ncbi:uncharacterized protein V1516DRAFT_673415, partial [Lipomyces oligophaga]|uniref:uncharacterized protein n=1 Tax=Lipomyces oligophaga TaxID=45792 RepID=UPI0034CE5E43
MKKKSIFGTMFKRKRGGDKKLPIPFQRPDRPANIGQDEPVNPLDSADSVYGPERINVSVHSIHSSSISESEDLVEVCLSSCTKHPHPAHESDFVMVPKHKRPTEIQQVDIPFPSEYPEQTTVESNNSIKKVNESSTKKPIQIPVKAKSRTRTSHLFEENSEMAAAITSFTDHMLDADESNTTDHSNHEVTEEEDRIRLENAIQNRTCGGTHPPSTSANSYKTAPEWSLFSTTLQALTRFVPCCYPRKRIISSNSVEDSSSLEEISGAESSFLNASQILLWDGPISSNSPYPWPVMSQSHPI